MTSSALRTAAVLVDKSKGTLLCPECNVLNLVRDSRLQCHCKFIANIIDCACECGLKLHNIDKRGRSKSFIVGHRVRLMIRPKCPRWKGGRKKTTGRYIKVKHEPYHPRKDDRGYVFEHVVVYEDYYHCCILSWIEVHHLNYDRSDNRVENLVLLAKSEHTRLHKTLSYEEMPTLSISI